MDNLCICLAESFTITVSTTLETRLCKFHKQRFAVTKIYFPKHRLSNVI